MIPRPSSLVLLFGLACAPAPRPSDATLPERGEATSRSTRSESIDCGPAITGAEALLQGGRLVMLGEIHGSNEAPAFVGRLACHAARMGLEVQLGLELPRSEAPALAVYLDSEGSPEDRALLLAGAHWQRHDQDGRSSEAMLALIERIRELEAAGLALELFAFDADSWSDWNDRDAAMAEAIIARAKAHPRALVLTLSGNVHVRATPGQPWDPDAVPMGVHVRAARPDALALELRHDGGVVWACRAGEQGQVCGPMRVQGQERSGALEIELSHERGEFCLDGAYWLRTLSPAPPAAELAPDSMH